MKHTSQPTTNPQHLVLQQRLAEGIGITCLAFALFLLLALLTDPPSTLGLIDTRHNMGGQAGHYLAKGLFTVFGNLAYLFPLFLCYAGFLSFRYRLLPWKPYYPFLLLQLLGFFAVIITACGLNASLSKLPTQEDQRYLDGGRLGFYMATHLTAYFNVVGARVFLTALFLAGTTLATGVSWLNVIDDLGARTLRLLKALRKGFIRFKMLLKRYAIRRRTIQTTPIVSAKIGLPAPAPAFTVDHIGSVTPKPIISQTSTETTAAAKTTILHHSTTTLIPPPLDLLDQPAPTTGKAYTDTELETLSREVEMRLQDFGIEVQVVTVHPGPVVTRFEMQLAPGIKVSRITSLAKDLARSLSVISVRIVEIIPGKSVVGLELPNRHREVVRLREILSATQYKQARSPLSLGLGKDIAGHPVVVDLAKMPHLLVAGTTGAGKSVGLNAMLLSILYKSTPDQVRLIMIDPKMLELAIYEGIPHLLAPVVTDMKEAANALRWCVAEMERRYQLMAALGVRNLLGYNQQVEAAQTKGQPIKNPLRTMETDEAPEYLAPLPYILVLIDEFADMIMVVGKKAEELIARIAQKARAAGIHLILATQRPSVDVITGLIKANIPTRIAFQVSSRIDSRTILDQQGAEQLLGYGDMLYLAPGTGVPVRVHGAFVDDHEVHRVVDALKQAGPPSYQLSITEAIQILDELDGTSESTDALDPLYDQAVQIVLETRRASTSSIQRRLKIGYNRAARLMEDMEKAGLVSPMETNGNREILVPGDSASS